jgi:hypothetical protein
MYVDDIRHQPTTYIAHHPVGRTAEMFWNDRIRVSNFDQAGILVLTFDHGFDFCLAYTSKVW